MAVSSHQTFQTQHYNAFSGVEEVLGAHVVNVVAASKQIQ
jgi:hypothetical protein